MSRGKIIVDAVWDDEACVFVATSSDVPGLVTEADTWEALQQKLAVLVPELLELNGGNDPCSDSPDSEVDLVVVSEHRSRVRLRA